ncbi:MAG: hypothetical protein AAGH45_08400 [Pseudomonadota bacterium]
MKKVLSANGFAFLAAIVLLSAAPAQPAQATGLAAVQGSLASWIDDPLLLAAVSIHNEDTAHLSRDELVAMNERWKVEQFVTVKPLTNRYKDCPLSIFLRDVRDGIGAPVKDIFVFDAKGMIVGHTSNPDAISHGEAPYFAETMAAALTAGEPSVDGQSEASLQVFHALAEEGEAGVEPLTRLGAPLIDPLTSDVIGTVMILAHGAK